jgi:hypothetical protein
MRNMLHALLRTDNYPLSARTLSPLPVSPVLTPLQTFCSKCLHRSLDHSPSCPLCRQDLPSISYFQDHSGNKLTTSLSTSLTLLIFIPLLPSLPQSSKYSHYFTVNEARQSKMKSATQDSIPPYSSASSRSQVCRQCYTSSSPGAPLSREVPF